MMIINNEPVYSDQELAEMAYERLETDKYWGTDKDSFILGYILGLTGELA